MKALFYFVCILLFVLPSFVLAQPTSDYNSDYNRERRNVQAQYEKQADINRQPNAPINRNTSLSQSDKESLENWLKQLKSYKNAPTPGTSGGAYTQEQKIEFAAIAQKRANEEYYVFNLFNKYNDPFIKVLPQIINQKMPCQTGDCISGLGTTNSNNIKLVANYSNGKLNGLATFYFTDPLLANVTVTYENTVLNGAATVYYHDGSIQNIEFTYNNFGGKAIIYFPNKEQIVYYRNKQNITGLFTHFYNNSMFSKYIFRENKLFTMLCAAFPGNENKFYPSYTMYSSKYFLYLYEESMTKLFDDDGEGGFYSGQNKNDRPNGFGNYAWSSGTSCYGDWKNGKLNGNAKFYYNTGEIYDGEVENGIRNGNGTMNYPNGNFYNGEWKKGDKSGKGKFLYADGSIYEGDFKDDKFSGDGTMLYASGSKYVGKWENDERSGKGTLTRKDGFYLIGTFRKNLEDQVKYYTPKNEEVSESVFDGTPESGFAKKMYENGAIYEGNWLNGKYHGEGKLMYGDGSVFKGEFIAGERKLGLVTWETGNTYLGAFKNDKGHGKGKYSWPNGEYFIGEFKDWNMNGFGTNYYADGVVLYEGNYLDDQKSGKGKAYYKDSQETYEGDWLNGKFNGTGKVTKKNGLYKIGTYKDFNEVSMKYYSSNNEEILKSVFDGNPENGFAKKMYENGAIYEGNWLNGKYHGEGKMIYSDGYVFKGEFFAGDRKFGLFTWPNGNTYNGEFKNNEATGKTKFTWASGDYYIGEFKDWNMNGFGAYYYADGVVFYEGNYLDGQKSGKGKAYYKDSQETYEGDWLNGKFNGIGKVTKKNGFYKIGTYKDFDVLSMKYYSPNGKEITLEEYNK